LPPHPQANAALAQSAASSQELVEQLVLLNISFARLSSAAEAWQATAAAVLPKTADLPADVLAQSPTKTSATADETRVQPTSPTSLFNEPDWQPSTPVAADCVTAQDGQSTNGSESEQAESAPASPADQLPTQELASDSNTGHSATPLPPVMKLHAGSINNTAACTSKDESTPVAAQLAEQPVSNAALPAGLWPFAEAPPSMICHCDVGCLASAQRWPGSSDQADAKDVAASEAAIVKHEQDAGPQVRHTVWRPSHCRTECHDHLCADAACRAAAPFLQRLSSKPFALLSKLD